MSDAMIPRRAVLQGLVAGMGAARIALGDSPAAPATQPGSGPAPGAGLYDDQKHTDYLFESVPRQFAFRAANADELKQWQAAFRVRLRELLGLAAMDREVKFAGRAELAERTKADGYTREKWYLWTEPDVPLPIWVLIPDQPVAKPYPLMLVPHGHNAPELYLGIAADEKQRKEITEGDRDIAVQAVREGYLAVLPTARGFGETMRPEDRKAKKVSSCATGLMHAMLFGRTMIGYRVWDVSRIIDWVGGRWEIDRRRIGITGNSGGGTTSVYAPACDERITVAAPSCSFCTYQASIGSIHHCECNYVPGLLREAEMCDVAGLIAPRPFLAIAGKDDPIFPIAAVRDAHQRLRQIYRVAGAEERCELYVGDGAHRYYKAGSWPFVKKWFERFAAS